MKSLVEKSSGNKKKQKKQERLQPWPSFVLGGTGLEKSAVW